MKLERISTHYLIRVNREDFLRLQTREFADPTHKLKHLYEELDELEGVCDTNYGYHFGDCIFISVEIPLDIPETHKKILQIIRKHLRRK